MSEPQVSALDYTWDWRNRLSSAERSGGIPTYGYDHTGQRVFQATGSATASYPNRYYNVASSSLTATTTKHIFSPDATLLATVVGSGTSTASTTYLHPDHLGGTNVATDEDGEVVQTLDYYPYGSQPDRHGSFYCLFGFVELTDVLPEWNQLSLQGRKTVRAPLPRSQAAEYQAAASMPYWPTSRLSL